jgi:hypothetical protein
MLYLDTMLLYSAVSTAPCQETIASPQSEVSRELANLTPYNDSKDFNIALKLKNLRDLSPRESYTDRATAVCRRS